MRAALLVLLLTCEAGAAGLTAASTLRRPVNARPTAMGGAFTAVAGGLASVGHNAAGLAWLERRELKTSYQHGIIEDKYTNIAYAHPFSEAVVTAGLAYYDAGTIHLEFSNGNRETRKAQQDFIGLFGVAVPLSESLAVGGLIKPMRLALAEAATATGAAADAGVLWRAPFKGLMLGGSVLNAGPDVKFESEGDPLPLTLRGGAAWNFSSSAETFAFSRFTITADAVKVRDEELRPCAGFEMAMSVAEFGSVMLRFGHVFNDEVASITAGVGVTESRFSLDYALGAMRGVNNVHHLTFGFSF